MLLIEKLRCLEHLDYLISHQVHGNPAEIAGKIGVSRSTLYEYIQVLAYYGGKIIYDRHGQCFYYEDNNCRKLRFDGNYRESQEK